MWIVPENADHDGLWGISGTQSDSRQILVLLHIVLLRGECLQTVGRCQGISPGQAGILVCCLHIKLGAMCSFVVRSREKSHVSLVSETPDCSLVILRCWNIPVISPPSGPRQLGGRRMDSSCGTITWSLWSRMTPSLWSMISTPGCHSPPALRNTARRPSVTREGFRRSFGESSEWFPEMITSLASAQTGDTWGVRRGSGSSPRPCGPASGGTATWSTTWRPSSAWRRAGGWEWSVTWRSLWRCLVPECSLGLCLENMYGNKLV